MISPAFSHWMHKIAQVRHHFTGWTSARSPAERSRQPTSGFWVEPFPIQVSFKSIKVNPSSSNWIQANPSWSNSIQASKEFGLVSQLLTYKTWQVPVGNCSDLDPLEMVYPPQMAINKSGRCYKSMVTRGTVFSNKPILDHSRVYDGIWSTPAWHDSD